MDNLERDGLDIDVSGLSAPDAAELAALFEAGATLARKASKPAQEGLLVGLAALLGSHAERLSEANGTAVPTFRLDDADGCIDLSKLTPEDALRGAWALLKMGEAFAAEGHSALGEALADTAAAWGRAANSKQAKARPADSAPRA